MSWSSIAVLVVLLVATLSPSDGDVLCFLLPFAGGVLTLLLFLDDMIEILQPTNRLDRQSLSLVVLMGYGELFSTASEASLVEPADTRRELKISCLSEFFRLQRTI